MDAHRALREDVKRLGAELGEVIRRFEGDSLFDQVEQIRRLSKEARAGDDRSMQRLSETLSALSLDEALNITRAFAQFLNLANIAEQHHRLRRRRAYLRSETESPQPGSLREVFQRLRNDGVSADRLIQTVSGLGIELVLTAHPTEIARRTLLLKYNRIAENLAELDREDRVPSEREEVTNSLRSEIASAWMTDEVRRERPTPVEEARSGLLVFEQSLWEAVPRFLRQLDRELVRVAGAQLPSDVAPVRFGSWMGGDRDGNPRVTAEVTREVSLSSRWMAAELLSAEVAKLREEISISRATEELTEKVIQEIKEPSSRSREPYRAILGSLHTRLVRERDRLGERLRSGQAGQPVFGEQPWLKKEEVMAPLQLCERSLRAVGATGVANGRLLDLLRRVACFGVTLVKLDLRQESSRHERVLDHVCQSLSLGSYATWDERRKQEFLLRELESLRPLIPRDLPADTEVDEVLRTIEAAREAGLESMGAYVISMAKAPSDVLAVELLLREVGGSGLTMPVVPLFETGADLQASEATMRKLLAMPVYRKRLRELHGNRQQVMLGYSDSAKDVGRLAANWDLYQAQERLVRIFAEEKVELTLFHGRGGSVSRGGGPIALAILSQPPGSVRGHLRVTEQGEMIQGKFGIPGIAERTLELYLGATLEASLLPPQAPRPEWRDEMNRLALAAQKTFRRFVHGDPGFVRYFRSVTPEPEFAELNIGSRPARRGSSSSGVESLRAIPWVFAWTQNRLILPGWLGFEEIIEHAVREKSLKRVQEMYAGWPFFRTTVDLVEMVLAKADEGIARRYDERLAPEELKPLGADLLSRLNRARESLSVITGHRGLLEGNAVLRRSIELRNPYVDPINLIQIEMLHRLRASASAEADRRLLEILLVTFNGVAAGMRSTG